MIDPQRLMDVTNAMAVIRNPHKGTLRDYFHAAEILAAEVERLRDFVRSHSCLCVGDVRCNRCKILEGE